MPELIPHIRPSAKWADGLADSERVWVEEYLIDLNGRQAGIRCGYQPGNASNEARRMLNKPAVAAAIDKALAERPGISRTRIVDELAKIAFANAGTFFQWGPDGVKVVDSESLDEEDRAAVSEVTSTETVSDSRTTVTTKLKLHDKIGALEKLGKVLRMFVDRQEISGPEGEPVQIEAVRDRVVGRLKMLRERTQQSADIAAATPVAIESPAEVPAETTQGGV
jgi:phage terminase small subunit